MFGQSESIGRRFKSYRAHHLHCLSRGLASSSPSGMNASDYFLYNVSITAFLLQRFFYSVSFTATRTDSCQNRMSWPVHSPRLWQYLQTQIPLNLEHHLSTQGLRQQITLRRAMLSSGQQRNPVESICDQPVQRPVNHNTRCTVRGTGCIVYSID